MDLQEKLSLLALAIVHQGIMKNKNISLRLAESSTDGINDRVVETKKKG